MTEQSAAKPKIAFQGEPGAYSHLACRDFAPDYEPTPMHTFEAVFAAVEEGRADRAMIPVENSLAGRVTDIHRLLPETELHIVGEFFARIRHQLLVNPGVELAEVKRVASHAMALGQCLGAIRDLGLEAITSGDTAGAAEALAKSGLRDEAAIASELAAEIYGLEILKRDIEDASHNRTRFLMMAREPEDPAPGEGRIITTFVFQVRNIPAALYKALGGFATNGVNMTKLESYQLGGSFSATRFYADIEGHPDEPPVRRALEELGFFSASLKVLGVYSAGEGRI